jgi:putative DNA primase/helicase
MANVFDEFSGGPPVTNLNGSKFVYPHTDHGNALMIAHEFRGKIMYVPQIGQFLCWSDNAKRWLREEHGGRKQLGRLVKRFITKRYAQAKSKKPLHTLNNEPVSLEDALKWAKASSAKSRIQAALDLLKNVPGVCVSQADLDTEPCLLGVANGVLDLRTGKLIENSPSLFVTRYCRPAYVPKAKAEKFLKFIHQVCLGRQGLVDFLQEVVGIAFSGLTKEQKFFILVGTGANGKSTLIETLFHLLGDYAMGMPSHAFIKSESRAIRNDIARLLGVRFAPCAEVNTGKSLDESMVKRVTGGDVMTARFIGKEFFDFHLAAKFFFSVNTLPKVTGADNGIYRRLSIVPFNADFSDAPDKELTAKLKGEGDGILVWAVAGFQRWYKRGHLVLPDCVIEACKAYRAEMDTVQSFLEDCCDIDDPKASTPIGVLFDAYSHWAKGSLVEPANLHLFGTLMGQKGFKKFKSGTWRWKGVALKASPTVVQPDLFGTPTQPQPSAPGITQ